MPSEPTYEPIPPLVIRDTTTETGRLLTLYFPIPSDGTVTFTVPPPDPDHWTRPPGKGLAHSPIH